MYFCDQCGKRLTRLKRRLGRVFFLCYRCGRFFSVDDKGEIFVPNIKADLSKDARQVVFENCNKRLNRAQSEAFNRVAGLLRRGNVRGIISLPTGVGKTLLAACLLRHLFGIGKIRLGEKVLVLAPRRVIVEQIAGAESDFQSMFKDLPVEIIDLSQLEKSKSWKFINLLETPGTRIIVATPQLIHKVLSSRYLADFDRIKALILDEVHHTYNGSKISESVKQIIEKCDFVLGLSATPTLESVNNVGRVLFRYSISEAMKNRILVSQVKTYRFDTEVKGFPSDCKDEWNVAIENRANKYAEKIFQVIEEERELNGQNRIFKTAVVCPNVTEADLLYDAVKEIFEQKKETVDVYCIHYRFSTSEIQRQLQCFRKNDEGILISVDMINIGFDDRNLEVLVLARPLKNTISYIQVKGRILRRPTTKWNIKRKYAVILDLVDNFEKHEKLINAVMNGEVGAGNFESELKGGKETLKVNAEVHIRPKTVTITSFPHLEQIPEPIVDIGSAFSSEFYAQQIISHLEKNSSVIIRIKDDCRLVKGDRVIELVRKEIEKGTRKRETIKALKDWEKIADDKEVYLIRRIMKVLQKKKACTKS